MKKIWESLIQRILEEPQWKAISLSVLLSISESGIYEILVKIGERERVNKPSTRWSTAEDRPISASIRQKAIFVQNWNAKHQCKYNCARLFCYYEKLQEQYNVRGSAHQRSLINLLAFKADPSIFRSAFSSLVFRLRQRNLMAGAGDKDRCDSISPNGYVCTITSSPVVIYADCCPRCRVSLYLTGILFYDFFRRERILRVNDAYAFSRDTRWANPLWPIFTLYDNHEDCIYSLWD